MILSNRVAKLSCNSKSDFFTYGIKKAGERISNFIIYVFKIHIRTSPVTVTYLMDS